MTDPGSDPADDNEDATNEGVSSPDPAEGDDDAPNEGSPQGGTV